MTTETTGASGTAAFLGSAALLIMKVLGKRAAELGEFFADVIRGWRLMNMARVAEKVERILQQRELPLEVRPLATGIGLALIEAASREDADDLQTVWANVLANHSDPNRGTQVDKDLIEVVRQLTSADALILSYLGRHPWDLHVALSGGFDGPRLAEALGLESSRVARSINNLWRLGCLVQLQAGRQMLDGASLRVVGPSADPSVSYRPSPLGETILEAVSP
jgi:Abortive infection alpha